MGLSELPYLFPTTACLCAGSLLFAVGTYIANPIRLCLVLCVLDVVFTLLAAGLAEAAGTTAGTQTCNTTILFGAFFWVLTVWTARLFYSLRINTLFSNNIYSVRMQRFNIIFTVGTWLVSTITITYERAGLSIDGCPLVPLKYGTYVMMVLGVLTDLFHAALFLKPLIYNAQAGKIQRYRTAVVVTLFFAGHWIMNIIDALNWTGVFGNMPSFLYSHVSMNAAVYWICFPYLIATMWRRAKSEENPSNTYGNTPNVSTGNTEAAVLSVPPAR